MVKYELINVHGTTHKATHITLSNKVMNNCIYSLSHRTWHK